MAPPPAPSPAIPVVVAKPQSKEEEIIALTLYHAVTANPECPEMLKKFLVEASPEAQLSILQHKYGTEGMQFY